MAWKRCPSCDAKQLPDYERCTNCGVRKLVSVSVPDLGVTDVTSVTWEEVEDNGV